MNPADVSVQHASPFDRGQTRFYLPSYVSITIQMWGEVTRLGAEDAAAKKALFAEQAPEAEPRMAPYLETALSWPAEMPHPEYPSLSREAARWALAVRLHEMNNEIDPPGRLDIPQDDACSHGVAFSADCAACDEEF